MAIPYFTFVDVKMDLFDRIFGRSKHVWSEVGGGQTGSVHEVEKACNIALENVRMMLERGPINQTKRFHILEKTIQKGKFIQPFITRIFLNVVKLVNAETSGYFNREGPVRGAKDPDSPSRKPDLKASEKLRGRQLLEDRNNVMERINLRFSQL